MQAILDRTTIVLPERLKSRAVEQAREEGVSFAEFVRRALENQLASTKDKTGDPFWDNLTAYDAAVPADLSVNHDDYLYGESAAPLAQPQGHPKVK